MKITNIDTFIEEFRNGRDIWSRASIELAVREIERLRKENNKLKVRLEASESDLVLYEVSEILKKTQTRVQELEQERQWIPVKEWPNIQGWYRVITGDGLEKTRFWGLDHENNRCFWHVESSNEWIMMWTKPTLPQPPQEEE